MVRSVVRPRVRSYGFSAVELLNFFALAAILAAIAMFFLSRYVRHGKTAEARQSLTRLGTEAAEFYNRSDANQPSGATPQAIHAMRHFPASSRTPVPEDPLSVRGKRYQSNKADWLPSPWKDLGGFSIVQPQCYQYSFESQGAGAGARAQVVAEGDLNGDGVRSHYALKISPDATLNAVVAKDMEQTDPEE
jgi:hypothetical protein